MDTEILLKSLAILIAAIGTGIAVFKTVLDFTLVKKSKGRDEYKFAKEFFADLAGPEPLHPYLKEKGFQALTGGNDLEVCCNIDSGNFTAASFPHNSIFNFNLFPICYSFSIVKYINTE